MFLWNHAAMRCDYLVSGCEFPRVTLRKDKCSRVACQLSPWITLHRQKPRTAPFK